MRVAVTGGTGFVGSHTAAALVGAGHDVRLLVRDAGRIAPALQPLGVEPGAVEVAVADVTDRASIAAGIEGVGALVHAASVYSFDPRRAREIAQINDAGVRNVLETAVDHNLDPIVHVSSTLALLRDEVVGDVLTPTSPAGNSPFPYSGSKARQEAFAQGLQQAGAPIVITNPGGVWGPNDPYDGESVQFARAAVRGRMSLLPKLSGSFVDVRDVAAVHAAVIEPGRGPRRYIVGGHNVPIDRLVDMAMTSCGRPRRTIRVPLAAGRGVAAIAGQLKARFGIDLGVDPEAIWVGSRRAEADSSHTVDELAITFRSLADSVDDQVRWMRTNDRF